MPIKKQKVNNEEELREQVKKTPNIIEQEKERQGNFRNNDVRRRQKEGISRKASSIQRCKNNSTRAIIKQKEDCKRRI